MISIDYQKRKNQDLFKSLEKPGIFLSKIQNYIPLYQKFFSLNDSNYNSINLNHKRYISHVKRNVSDNPNLFECMVKEDTKTKECDVFFKFAPLLDPCKYLIGKYNPDLILNLPNLESSEETFPKMLDLNNSAYVDSFFVYLTSQLLSKHRFIHGVDFLGSFLCIKNNYKLNIFDDLEYLAESDFFNKQKNVLFKVDNYDYILDSKEKLKPIKIHDTLKSIISIETINDDIFENIFTEDTLDTFTEIHEMNITDNKHLTTNKSNSSCSSRTSYTLSEDETVSNIDDSDDTDSFQAEIDTEEKIYVTFPKFPVQVICMENCEDTFDNLIDEEITTEEWYSAFMQIIMILLTYQKAFAFTHNDLHTNNVMYNRTNKKYIYYKYNQTYYKVPTFGRIFKIIDFGRAIYKFNNNIFCSDSFKNGGDAATQYNTEPYFNENKPRIEPNFSFDLCRLACSIFDYIIEDISEIANNQDPIVKLVYEWCIDDNGINVLYKNNGDERYPDFKLYKMIARSVHKHTPQAQLERSDFKKYMIVFNKDFKEVMDIDSIPSYT